jgi:hypothetical protein
MAGEPPPREVVATPGWPPIAIPGRPGWWRHYIDSQQIDLPTRDPQDHDDQDDEQQHDEPKGR